MTETNVAESLRADQKMDAIMGILLRTGVALAAGIVLIGGIVFLTRHRVPVMDYRVFSGEPVEYRTISGIFHDAVELQGRGMIQLGLLVLIATPVARVLFSLLAFLYQKDWKYTVFTAMVLGLLFYSLFSGSGG